MIRGQWYAVMDAKEIPHGKPVGVMRMAEKMVLWRNRDGVVHCLSDKCCHRGASLSTGVVYDDAVNCPFHGFSYDGSGKVIRIPANGKHMPVPDRYHVKAYKVVEKHGIIWLWNGDETDESPDIPFFEELEQGFSYGSFSEVWPVHYTRAIENQLDVVHLPYVHANSIGRGNRTLVNGPVVRWEANRMTFYVNNKTDDGMTRPMEAEDILEYQDLFSLQLQMPNLWQNRISAKVRIVAFFAPVDDAHTKIYLRFYQSFMKLPVLRQVVNWTSRFSNRYILHQDRQVVLTQRPVKSELRMGEHLIQGDAPILEYRKRRAALKRDSREKTKGD